MGGKERSQDNIEDEFAQRAEELNNKIDLARMRWERATKRLMQHPDRDFIAGIVSDYLYVAKLEGDSLWITSLAESDGSIIKAWDMVEDIRRKAKEGQGTI